MKHFFKLLLAVMTLFTTSSNAQNSNNPWVLSFGVNAVDTRTSAGGEKNWLDIHFSQMFNVNENWNILPSVSYLSIARLVGNNFSVGLQGSINKMSKYVNFDPTAPGHNDAGYVVTNPGDLMYYGFDVSVKYSFMSLIKSKVIDPSISLGGGYTFLGDNSYGSVNPFAGLTFWFTENVGLALGTAYKNAFVSKTDLNVRSHFQHTAGITFTFGDKHTDGVGIYDKDNACPEVAGLKQFNDYPDTDGDGIFDGSDACPDVFGLDAFNGCPDTDGDGIIDRSDACPDVFGLAALNGCADTDGDGITDVTDKCPTLVGPASNGGCPILDTVKDEVPDLEDVSPPVAGPAGNKGYPEVTPEVIENLNIEARSVYFDSGKSTLKGNGTSALLDEIKEILMNYPNTKFSIEGHSDTDGSNAFNQKLSDDRANAVRNALIEKGVKPENLIAVGFGETKPIATNKTKAGKAQNRRTEVKHLGTKYEGKL